jgi:hypothetical protein
MRGASEINLEIANCDLKNRDVPLKRSQFVTAWKKCMKYQRIIQETFKVPNWHLERLAGMETRVSR